MGDFLDLTLAIAAGLLMAASVVGSVLLLGGLVAETQGERAGALFLGSCAVLGLIVTAVAATVSALVHL